MGRADFFTETGTNGRRARSCAAQRRSLARLLPVAAVLALAACAPEKPAPPKLVLQPVAMADLPGWRDDDPSAALPALRKSCDVFAHQPPDKPVGPDAVGGHAGDWRAPCAALAAVASGDAAGLRAVLESRFRAWRATDNGDAKGLITGYYEPELHGARRRSARYGVPLYRRPPDLVTVDLGAFRPSLKGERLAGRIAGQRLVPYAPRARIVRGALAGQGLELAWVDDPVDAFFLQIQGSGRVVLEDGTVLRVGYDGTNGHAYTSIGRVLARDGTMDAAHITMQSLRAWIAAHPAEGRKLMDRNASYVFFRELEGDGPVGAQGVALTPGRSLAIDPRFLPLGAPIWLVTTDPLAPDRRVARLMAAQDTGGAIRGPVRADLFWGHGPEAAARAGQMKQTGELYLLLPRAATDAPTG